MIQTFCKIPFIPILTIGVVGVAFATVPLTYSPQPTNSAQATLNTVAKKPKGKAKRSFFGGNYSGYGEFDNEITMTNPGAADSGTLVGGLSGIYLQVISRVNNVGPCNEVTSSADCVKSSFQILEWYGFGKGAIGAKFNDTIGLGIESGGCSKWYATANFFVPSSAQGFDDLKDHLERHYNSSTSKDGKKNKISDTGIPDHPEVGTGIFNAGVFDKDGDNKEDLAGEPLEDILAEIGQDNLIRPAGGSHMGSITWNLCTDSRDGGAVPRNGLGGATTL